MTRSLAVIVCALSLSALSFAPAYSEESASSKADPTATTKVEPQQAKPVDANAATKSEAQKSEPADTAAAPRDKKSKSDAAAPTGRISSFCSKLPKNVPAFLAGWVVGTPIAIARMSKREIIAATRDLVGDTSNPILLGAGGVLGVPAGLMSGGMYGAYAGVADSWVNANDNPYSKDSFSLGEMK